MQKPSIALALFAACGAGLANEEASYTLGKPDLNVPGDYFVEFVARGEGISGHSWVALGRQSPAGKVISYHVIAGFYPDAGKKLASSFSVFYSTGVVMPDDLPTSSDVRFRIKVTPDQERQARFVLRHWDTKMSYAAISQNCVSMARDIARALNLSGSNVDPAALTPRSFVRSLAASNGPYSAIVGAVKEQERQNFERIRATTEQRARTQDADRRFAEDSRLPSARSARINDAQPPGVSVPLPQPRPTNPGASIQIVPPPPTPPAPPAPRR